MRRVTESRDKKFLLGEEAHLPRDVAKVVRFIAGKGPGVLRTFWKKQIEPMEIMALQCRRETGEWRASLLDAQRMVAGKLNLPLSARTLGELGMEAKMGAAVRNWIPHWWLSS